jgi:glutamate-1-semialdehyde 2,1-aminomutase
VGFTYWSLKPEYESRTGGSKELFERAKKVFAGGVNHNARFYEPYPLFVKKAKGQHIWDADGNRYTDYWMGHTALILGHSPGPVVRALERQVGQGTHFGMGSELSVDLGEEIQSAVPCAEMLRFCNTGAEATMYLVRLARAFTRKRTIIKMAGGWHGYNTELNKGVRSPFNRSEGAGILPEEQAYVTSVRFNDLEAARGAVADAQGDVAAIFLEPVLGAGGCIPADKEYLRGLRELTDEAGILLAFDEIITGFRVALGGAQEQYGITPDLATFGKVAGGGLPLGLVCGRKDILMLADPSANGRFVSIGGGTFSENPLTMTAGLATVRYLRKNAADIYPRLRRMGDSLRRGVDGAFSEVGLEAHTTGTGSLFLTHFGISPRSAEEAGKEDRETLREYALHLMSSGIFCLPEHIRGVSTAHTRLDIEELVETSRSFGLSRKKKRAK